MRKKGKVTRTSKRTFTSLMLAAAFAALFIVVASGTARAQRDPLASWNDGASKKAIVTFVNKVTKAGSPDFVPPAERIATFDSSGSRTSRGAAIDL